MQNGVKISAEALQSFASELLQAGGAQTSEAAIVAGSLVQSNLRGHESHGVMRVIEYVDSMSNGDLVAGAPFNVINDLPQAVVADASLGFGQVQMTRLIDELVSRATSGGIACGTLNRCGHVGRLGEWVEVVAARGFAGIVSVNDNGVLQCVAPPGGTEPRISTNPVAIGIPTGTRPVVLDISTSAVANGKIRVAALSGSECPSGWLQDADGNPTGDPTTRTAEPPGSILPMGGEQGYKGFGLGLMFDFLVGGLSGGQCPPADEGSPMTNNVLMVVWDPERFAGREHFLTQADQLISYVRDSHLKPGVEGIRLPNDRSQKVLQERSDDGIPLDDGTWRELVTLANRVDIAVPQLS